MSMCTVQYISAWLVKNTLKFVIRYSGHGCDRRSMSARITVYVPRRWCIFKFSLYTGSEPHEACLYRKNLLPCGRWALNSPDMPLIEHVWYKVKMEIRNRNPSTVRGLKRASHAAWNSIDQEYLDKLWDSIENRANAILAANGGASKYWTRHFSCSFVWELYKWIFASPAV